jgi:hypothetical protein
LLDAARPAAAGHLDGLEPQRWKLQYEATGGYRYLVVTDDRIYLSMVALGPFRGTRNIRGSGIYSFDRSLNDPREHVWLDGWAIGDFTPFLGGRICWLHAERGLNPIEHLMAWAGADAASIPDGFEPVAVQGIPNLRLHDIWNPRRPSLTRVIRPVP